jgi:exodeoxyribonuclease VIII
MTTIHPNISNPDYHANPSISKSGLDLIARAPALYRYRRDNPTPRTDAMRWGSLVHTAILEPDKFADSVIIIPDDAPSRPTKKQREAKKPSTATLEAIAWWQAFDAAVIDREPITIDEHAELLATRDAAWADPIARKALSQIELAETSIFWKSNDIECRCRPDAILTSGAILDLKTTRDAAPDPFAKSIAAFRYHVQAAFYSDGYAEAFGEMPRGFMFLAIEKDPPYLSACYVATDAMIMRGRMEYQRDLDTYARCLETGEWPGLTRGVTEIDLPKWA